MTTIFVPPSTAELTTRGAPIASLDALSSYGKRRGFIFPGSELYGGLQGTWDYGQLGSLLKDDLKADWKRAMAQERDDIVLMDGATLTHQRIWEASGHVANFSDPLRDCRGCHRRVRADQVEGDLCPDCAGALTDPRQFNLMVATHLGPVADSASLAYLRPETAQVIFAQFRNVLATSRLKVPFGIAQVGKAYRNEITPGHFTFRSREFEQMELEFFVKPGTDEAWHRAWIEQRLAWWKRVGLRAENLRVREHGRDELAHYARGCVDIEYRFPTIGWAELEGIANRADFDLTQHAIHSGQDLRVFDEVTREHYTPFVIEPSAGADRGVLALLSDAYREEPDRDGVRVVLGLSPRVAPIKVAVLPLVKKPEVTGPARELAQSLRRRWMVSYDETQSVGRRYRRHDEIGVPLCVTVDFQTIEDMAVTVRDRDTMAQERVPLAELEAFLVGHLEAPTN